MPGSQEIPEFDRPNAPKITHHLYIQEKIYFFGILVDPILYGFLVVLFFRCMAALFDPIHRRGERTNWWLVSYTVFMFLAATAQTAMAFYLRMSSYVDNREFPGFESTTPPGPLGYESLSFKDALVIVDDVMFYLGTWLADGLLLYRCYIIYSANLWVIAFPASLTGILSQVAGSKDFSYSSIVTNFGLPYLSISASLNIFLTLMIIIRLILHTRNIRTVMGIIGIGGLSRSIITMLVESCTLHTISSLLVLVPWAAGYHDGLTFVPILTQTQVIAPLLIIQRVANKSALTKNTLVSGRCSWFKTRTRGEVTGSGGALPGRGAISSLDGHGMPGELGGEVTIGFHQDET